MVEPFIPLEPFGPTEPTSQLGGLSQYNQGSKAPFLVSLCLRTDSLCQAPSGVTYQRTAWAELPPGVKPMRANTLLDERSSNPSPEKRREKCRLVID